MEQEIDMDYREWRDEHYTRSGTGHFEDSTGNKYTDEYLRGEYIENTTAYREWKDDNYTEMNDGTYQTHDGRDVKESEMREHYDRHPEVEHDYSRSR